MIYLSPSSKAEVLRHAIHQAKCAQSMVQKIAGTEDIDSDLTSVITRLRALLGPLDVLLDEMESV